MRIIVFDFEVFRYDVLLGAIVLENNMAPSFLQTWDKEEIKRFYYSNLNAIWVGHNNENYDNIILQGIIKNEDIYHISQNIVEGKKKYFLNIPLNYYDIISLHFGSLKAIEAAVGKNISESEVDFNLYRELTHEEKLKTESYNRDDLNQTLEDLKLVKSEFQLRLDLIKEFNLPLSVLHMTQAQIAAKVLKAKALSVMLPYEPILYPNMQIKNKVALDFYLNKRWKQGLKPTTVICEVEHQLGEGGIHAARSKYRCDRAFYFDVSGYYNLVMINYDLLSRAIPEEGKKLYEYMYHQQLALKGVDDAKRQVYKTILLAVFGAQKHEGSALYDLNKGTLVPIVGQMFLIDLLEKLEGKIELVQSNTDGIIVKPLVEDKIILDIVEEWCNRTHLVIKPKVIYDIVQRDVNNYMYRDDKGKIHTKGEAVKYYNNWQNPLASNCFKSKEALITHHCIVEYFMNNIKPEDYIKEHKNELRLFQYICKPESYDSLVFETGNESVSLQKVNRAFASKRDGMIYKVKEGKHDKYSNLPNKVFVHNGSIDTVDTNMIDYDYYVRRSYERIDEFIPPVTLF